MNWRKYRGGRGQIFSTPMTIMPKNYMLDPPKQLPRLYSGFRFDTLRTDIDHMSQKQRINMRHPHPVRVYYKTEGQMAAIFKTNRARY